MGNHSNKRKKVVNPETGETDFGFDFVQGKLGGLHRVIARHQLKDRITMLEKIIKVHVPLMEARKLTQNAYQQGFLFGIQHTVDADKAVKETEAEPSTPVSEKVSE